MRFRDAHRETQSSTQRIEAFSDGVFAIAITLLILEIHFKRLSESAPDTALQHELLSLWPSYFAYVFSFVLVGIYWANHHYVFQLYKRTNHMFNLLNLFFLMCISFLPLPTAVLGEYLLDEKKRRVAIIFYICGLFMPALSWFFMWTYASRNYHLIDERLEPRFVRHLSIQYTLSFLLYLLSIGIALWNATVGLSIALGLTLLYLLPPKHPYYRDGVEAER